MNALCDMQSYSVPLRAVVNVTSIDMEFAIVAAPPRPSYRPPTQTVQRLIDEAERLWGVPAGSVKSASRRKEITLPRFAVIYAARRITRPQRSYPEIGRLIGGRDHTTILHGDRRAQELRKTDGDFASLLACLMLTAWRARRVHGSDSVAGLI